MIPISKSHCIIQYEIDLLCDPQLLQKGMGQATWAPQVLNSYSDGFIDPSTNLRSGNRTVLEFPVGTGDYLPPQSMAGSRGNFL